MRPAQLLRLVPLVAFALAAALALNGPAGAAPVGPPAPFAPVAGSPFSTGAGAPSSVSFSPNGHLLASADVGDSPEGIPDAVSVFALSSTGRLTPVAGSPFAAGHDPTSLSFAPGGGLAAVANGADNTVSVFSVSAAGALAPVAGSPFPTGTDPQSVTFSPGGSLLAVANYGANTTSVFSVSPAGSLTPVAGSPFATGAKPASVAFSPSGSLLATADYGDSTVSMFAVSAAGGSLAAVPGSPFTTGTGPMSGSNQTPGLADASVAFSANGALLAVANSGDETSPTSNDTNIQGTLSMFSVSPDGALSPVPQTPVETSLPANSVTFSPMGLIVTEWSLGVGAAPGALQVFSVSTSGALTPVGSGPLQVGHPDDAAFSPDGTFLAVADFYDDQIPVFAPATVNTSPPAITGTAKAGAALSCSTGAWTPTPRGYAYRWDRNGLPISSATGPSYTVKRVDEGTTLTCIVTATSSAGSAAGANAKVHVPVPYVPHCPAATGSLTGTRLGPVKLGMTRAQARRAMRHSSVRSTAHSDFFCLTPEGVRVGYRAGRVAWISTASADYSVLGTAVGGKFAGAGRAPIRLGSSAWYLAFSGPATAIVETRHGVTQEIGLTTHRLTRTRRAQRSLLASFG